MNNGQWIEIVSYVQNTIYDIVAKIHTKPLKVTIALALG
jgi:hypothetical protein